MQSFILLLHVGVSVALISLVLLQQGKGAEAGAAFGGGASQTFFGSQGATSFLVKFTAGLATVFFMTSLMLGAYTGKALMGNKKVDIITQATQSVSDVPELPVEQ